MGKRKKSKTANSPSEVEQSVTSHEDSIPPQTQSPLAKAKENLTARTTLFLELVAYPKNERETVRNRRIIDLLQQTHHELSQTVEACQQQNNQRFASAPSCLAEVIERQQTLSDESLLAPLQMAQECFDLQNKLIQLEKAINVYQRTLAFNKNPQKQLIDIQQDFLRDIFHATLFTPVLKIKLWISIAGNIANQRMNPDLNLTDASVIQIYRELLKTCTILLKHTKPSDEGVETYDKIYQLFLFVEYVKTNLMALESPSTPFENTFTLISLLEKIIQSGATLQLDEESGLISLILGKFFLNLNNIASDQEISASMPYLSRVAEKAKSQLAKYKTIEEDEFNAQTKQGLTHIIAAAYRYLASGIYRLHGYAPLAENEPRKSDYKTALTQFDEALTEEKRLLKLEIRTREKRKKAIEEAMLERMLACKHARNPRKSSSNADDLRKLQQMDLDTMRKHCVTRIQVALSSLITNGVNASRLASLATDPRRQVEEIKVIFDYLHQLRIVSASNPIDPEEKILQECFSALEQYITKIMFFSEKELKHSLVSILGRSLGKKPFKQLLIPNEKYFIIATIGTLIKYNLSQTSLDEAIRLLRLVTSHSEMTKLPIPLQKDNGSCLPVLPHHLMALLKKIKAASSRCNQVSLTCYLHNQYHQILQNYHVNRPNEDAYAEYTMLTFLLPEYIQPQHTRMIHIVQCLSSGQWEDADKEIDKSLRNIDTHTHTHSLVTKIQLLSWQLHANQQLGIQDRALYIQKLIIDVQMELEQQTIIQRQQRYQQAMAHCQQATSAIHTSSEGEPLAVPSHYHASATEDEPQEPVTEAAPSLATAPTDPTDMILDRIGELLQTRPNNFLEKANHFFEEIKSLENEKESSVQKVKYYSFSAEWYYFNAKQYQENAKEIQRGRRIYKDGDHKKICEAYRSALSYAQSAVTHCQQLQGTIPEDEFTMLTKANDHVLVNLSQEVESYLRSLEERIQEHNEAKHKLENTPYWSKKPGDKVHPNTKLARLDKRECILAQIHAVREETQATLMYNQRLLQETNIDHNEHQRLKR